MGGSRIRLPRDGGLPHCASRHGEATQASFLAWACGTSTVGTDLFNWPTASAEATGKLIVTSAVFLIPLLDGLLTKLFPEARAFPKPQP